MNRFYQLVILAFLCLIFTGCSYLPDRSSEYLENDQTLSGLAIPPGFGTSEVGDDLTIPNVQSKSRKNLLLPPESSALDMAEGRVTAKELKEREIQSRLAQITWSQNKSGTETLLINRSIKTVWPHLERALLKLSGSLRVKSKNEASGVVYFYDQSQTHGKLKSNASLYQLHLIEFEKGTMLVLATGENAIPLSPDVNQRILSKLREALNDTKEGLTFKQWLGW